MNILRGFRKVIEKYEILLQKYEEEAKRGKNDFIKDVEAITEALNSYIDETDKEFQIWCDTSVAVFEEKDNNLCLKIKKKVDMVIVNYHLNKLSAKLSKAGLLQKRLLKIKQRFVQYQYFIS